MTFSRDTHFQARRPSDKQKKSRFDSLHPEAGHYVPGGRRLSNNGSDSPGPAKSSSEASESISDSLSGSAESSGSVSNPGHALLRVMGAFPGKTVKRTSTAGLEPHPQARARDGGRTTTGTAEVNPGKAVRDFLNKYPGDPNRASARRSITVIPTTPHHIGVLPIAYAEDDGCPGPSTQPAGIEEEKTSDSDRSPTDTRCPQLPVTFLSPQGNGVSSLGFAMQNVGTPSFFDGLR